MKKMTKYEELKNWFYIYASALEKLERILDNYWGTELNEIGNSYDNFVNDYNRLVDKHEAEDLGFKYDEES